MSFSDSVELRLRQVAVYKPPPECTAIDVRCSSLTFVFVHENFPSFLDAPLSPFLERFGGNVFRLGQLQCHEVQGVYTLQLVLTIILAHP